MSQDGQPGSVDAVLDRAERNLSRLADGSLALEELVVAYEEAGRLLDEAEDRIRQLREGAAIPVADH